jgi:hypothetical protein
VAAVAQPAGHVRRIAVAHRALQHVVREAVDLEEEQARDVARDRAGTACLAAHHVALPRVVIVDRQHRRGRRGQHGEPDRDHDPGDPPVDLRARAQCGRDRDERTVEREGGEAEREDAEGQREAAQRRPQQRVEQGDDERGDERTGRAVDVEVGEQRAEDE